jgi:hypothetical protein
MFNKGGVEWTMETGGKSLSVNPKKTKKEETYEINTNEQCTDY